jgi:hypothetical protein
MPQIIVTADRSTDRGEDMVMLRERLNLSDLESEHFARQLLERLGWAVGDAHEVEDQAPQGDVADQAPEHEVEGQALRELETPAALDEEPARAEVEQYLAELSGQQSAQELEGAALR